MLDTLLVILVVIVFAVAVFAFIGWITMCGFFAGQFIRMVQRAGRSDAYVPHIPTPQELADAAQSERIEQLLRESDEWLRESDESLRQHRRFMMGDAAR